MQLIGVLMHLIGVLMHLIGVLMQHASDWCANATCI